MGNAQPFLSTRLTLFTQELKLVPRSATAESSIYVLKLFEVFMFPRRRSRYSKVVMTSWHRDRTSLDVVSKGRTPPEVQLTNERVKYFGRLVNRIVRHDRTFRLQKVSESLSVIRFVVMHSVDFKPVQEFFCHVDSAK